MTQKKTLYSLFLLMTRYMLIIGTLLMLAISACGGGFKSDSSNASILSDPVFGHPQDSLSIGP